MATLAQLQKLSNDMFVAGVMEEIITADQMMAYLQFENAGGKSYVWNREGNLPGSGFFEYGDTVPTGTSTFAQKTTTLKRAGVQENLDRFVKATLSTDNSQESEHVSRLAKSLARKIAQQIITGDGSGGDMNGLLEICDNESRIVRADSLGSDIGTHIGTAETTLTLPMMDRLLDEIDEGRSRPDILVMNTAMRRKLTALSRAAGSGVVMDMITMYGHNVMVYDGIPIIINNWIRNDLDFGNSSTFPSSTATAIFALNLGKAKQGYTILHEGPLFTPSIEYLGTDHTKDEDIYRAVAYVEAITYSTKQIAQLSPLDSAS